MLLIFEMEPSPKDSQGGLSSSLNIDFCGRGRENHLFGTNALFFPTFLSGVVGLLSIQSMPIHFSSGENFAMYMWCPISLCKVIMIKLTKFCFAHKHRPLVCPNSSQP